MSSVLLPENLLPLLKDKHLLLDTNVFIDSLAKPSLYSQLYNKLKDNNTFLATIDFVKMEILKGAEDATRYNTKERLITDVTETILPNMPTHVEQAYELIKKYQEDGKSLSITDYYLGVNLMHYKSSLLLMTRNTTEFPERIFNLVGSINVFFDKTLHAYGVYQYPQ